VEKKKKEEEEEEEEEEGSHFGVILCQPQGQLQVLEQQPGPFFSLRVSCEDEGQVERERS